MQLACGSAPGKLYIAGEYAVVHAGNPSILIAVDRYVTARVASLESAETAGCDIGQWRITSAQFPDTVAYCTRAATHGNLIPNTYVEELSFACAAVSVADAYAQAITGQTLSGALHITSGLQSEDGRKLGLGSSAAVCVAVVKAVLQVYKVAASALEIYKIAALAHFAIQGNGSLGDIAASSMGGVLYYRSCDRDWLAEVTQLRALCERQVPALARIEQLAQVDVQTLVREPWPKLVIEPIDTDPTVHVMVGWTGTPASTKELVAKAAKPVHPDDYQVFLKRSERSVDELRAEIEHPQGHLQEIVAQLRSQLLELARLRDVPIETSTLAAGIDIACKHGLAAKSSGAGGGDCFIALYEAEETEIASVHKMWKTQGIMPLNLHIAPSVSQANATDTVTIARDCMSSSSKL